MNAGKVQSPFKWPFPPRPRVEPGRRSAQGYCPEPIAGGTPRSLTPKAMVADVILVIVWGATIPGIMWLGAAGGF